MQSNLATLSLQVFPHLEQEAIHKIVEANPAILTKSSRQLLSQIAALRVVLGAEPRPKRVRRSTRRQKKKDGDTEKAEATTSDEREEDVVCLMISRYPTILCQSVDTTRTKLEKFQFLIDNFSGCLDDGVPPAVKAQALVCRQPTLLASKSDTLEERLQKLWHYSRRAERAGFSKWSLQLNKFMAGENEASFASLLRLSVKRQDERLSAVCTLLECRTDESSGNARVVGGDIPSITTFLVSNDSRFQELCGYL